MWLVTEHFKCASVTEQLIYKFYLILIKLKSYRWLIPTVLGTIGMKCAEGGWGGRLPAGWSSQLSVTFGS